MKSVIPHFGLASTRIRTIEQGSTADAFQLRTDNLTLACELVASCALLIEHSLPAVASPTLVSIC